MQKKRIKLLPDPNELGRPNLNMFGGVLQNPIFAASTTKSFKKPTIRWTDKIRSQNGPQHQRPPTRKNRVSQHTAKRVTIRENLNTNEQELEPKLKKVRKTKSPKRSPEVKSTISSSPKFSPSPIVLSILSSGTQSKVAQSVDLTSNTSKRTGVEAGLARLSDDHPVQIASHKQTKTALLNAKVSDFVA